MDNTNIQLEDLLTALATLTEHNQALLEQREQLDVASTARANETADLIKQLTSQLKEYQEKEKMLTDETLEGIQRALSTVFKQNQESYHKAINKGFTTHIKQLTIELSQVSSSIKQQLQQLQEDARRTQKEFEYRNTSILAYEDSYKTQSDKLKQNVANTLKEVSNSTKTHLEALSDEYVSQLTWKTGLILGGVCLFIILLTFFIAWLFIPSKSEIAERRANYVMLERYDIADNVVKGKDGYYADVKKSTCFTAKDGNFYCKFR